MQNGVASGPDRNNVIPRLKGLVEAERELGCKITASRKENPADMLKALVDGAVSGQGYERAYLLAQGMATRKVYRSIRRKGEP